MQAESAGNSIFPALFFRISTYLVVKLGLYHKKAFWYIFIKNALSKMLAFMSHNIGKHSAALAARDADFQMDILRLSLNIEQTKPFDLLRHAF
jgi:hypothetical protein